MGWWNRIYFLFLLQHLEHNVVISIKFMRYAIMNWIHDRKMKDLKSWKTGKISLLFSVLISSEFFSCKLRGTWVCFLVCQKNLGSCEISRNMRCLLEKQINCHLLWLDLCQKRSKCGNSAHVSCFRMGYMVWFLVCLGFFPSLLKSF